MREERRRSALNTFEIAEKLWKEHLIPINRVINIMSHHEIQTISAQIEEIKYLHTVENKMLKR